MAVNGTMLHSEIAKLFLNKRTMKFAPILDQIRKLFTGFVPIFIEKKLSHNNLVGKIDALLTKDNVNYLIDWKTRKTTCKTLDKYEVIQLNLYRHLCNGNGIQVDQMYVCEIVRGKINLIKCPQTDMNNIIDHFNFYNPPGDTTARHQHRKRYRSGNTTKHNPPLL